jgi:hypothetical protein
MMTMKWMFVKKMIKQISQQWTKITMMQPYESQQFGGDGE